MKAVIADAPGGSETLRLADVPVPEPGPGQYLLRVQAAGVNPVDWKLRRDLFGRALRARFPYIPGCECSGTVERCGPGARRFAPGDDVLAVLDARTGGASAEYALVEESMTLARPATLSPVEAAGLPCAALTALIGLRLGRARAGSRVLLNGAAGGVGHLALQAARALGAHVTAVCSARNVEFVRGLGADEVVDYGAADIFASAVRGGGYFDLFFDVVPTKDFWSARRVLAPGGTYVTTMPGAGPALALLAAPLLGRRARFVIFTPQAEDIARLAHLAESGRLRVAIERTYPLAELAAAHDRSETGRVRGKLVVVVS